MKSNYTIKIPSTNGFVGRCCRSKDCGKYFQIHEGNISDELICPYCGEKSPIDSMWTNSQANYARDIVAEEVMYDITNEFNKIFKDLERSTRGSNFVKFKASSTPYHKKYIRPLRENKIDSEISCSECNGKFQVFGIFGFCPICKYENIKIYDANLTIIEREVETSTNKQRALRHAYGDLVSTFENFCRKYSFQSDSINFQNLRNAKQYFKKQNKTDIYMNLTDGEKTKIKRVFMKRHVYVHSNGIVSEQYVKEIPEDKKLLGQEAVLSKEEFIEGADILRRIINNIVNSKLNGNA